MGDIFLSKEKLSELQGWQKVNSHYHKMVETKWKAFWELFCSVISQVKNIFLNKIIINILYENVFEKH